MPIKKESRYVVYEYNENASTEYQGCRFMTMWTEPIKQKENSKTNIIAENLSESDANVLVRQTSFKNNNAYLNSLPKELRNERVDNYILNILKRS